jgi:hypothetical protein
LKKWMGCILLLKKEEEESRGVKWTKKKIFCFVYFTPYDAPKYVDEDNWR